jgi:hypothetical protein
MELLGTGLLAMGGAIGGLIGLAILIAIIAGGWKMYAKAGQPGWAFITRSST